MTNSTDIDDAIREALSAEDARMLERFSADQGLQAQLAATLQGRYRWLNGLGWIAGFALFAAACYCGWRMTHSDEVGQAIGWATGTVASLIGLALVKIWFWMELQKNTIVREIKRVELQVASLASRTRT